MMLEYQFSKEYVVTTKQERNYEGRSLYPFQKQQCFTEWEETDHEIRLHWWRSEECQFSQYSVIEWLELLQSFRFTEEVEM